MEDRGPRSGRRLVAAQLTIDESTAVALANEDRGRRAGQLGFWVTGLAIFLLGDGPSLPRGHSRLQWGAALTVARIPAFRSSALAWSFCCAVVSAAADASARPFSGAASASACFNCCLSCAPSCLAAD